MVGIGVLLGSGVRRSRVAVGGASVALGIGVLVTVGGGVNVFDGVGVMLGVRVG